jgi:hypothetical protein
MKGRYALLIIFLVLIFFQPSFAQIRGQNNRHQETANTKKETHSYQQGTENRPFIVKTTPGTKSKPETDYETYQTYTKPWYDFGITWSTVWLAIVTTSLAIYTALLWRATKGLVETSENLSKQHLRAFVFSQGFTYAPHITGNEDRIKEYVFWAVLKNVGLTPATDVCVWAEVKTSEVSDPVTPVFNTTHERTPTPLGPQAPFQTGFLRVPIETMMLAWQREIGIFIWCRVEYRDIFDTEVIHHHEQCFLLDVIHDPSDLPKETHPSYIQFRIHGPQNSTA